METLRIGGVDCRSLADEFGTPLYVYDEAKIMKQADDAVLNFSSDKFDTEVVYASKAFSSVALFKLLAAQGIGFDVVSGGELYCAMKAGVGMDKVYFHGNNKSDQEIEMALDAGIGYFVIDNVMECNRLVGLAEKRKRSTESSAENKSGYISAYT